MKRLIILVCALWFVPAIAFAEPKTADEWYKEGETQYNLGNFEKAADAFKQGYSLETIENKKPAYLFNVAQAYRQANKCRDAVFFYKRFISLKDQDTVKPLSADKRAEIQQRIAELEECAKNQDAIRSKPPEDTIHTDTGSGSGSSSGSGSGSDSAATGSGSGSGSNKRIATGSGSGSGSDEDDENDENGGHAIHKGTTPPPPKMLTARFTAGGAKILAGGLSVPIQGSFALTAGYPLPVKIPKISVDVGGVLASSPIKYTNSITNANTTGSMNSVLVNAGATMWVAPKIYVRGDLGVGAMFFGGIEQMGSPFTAGGAGTTGMLAMFAVRFAASADYMLTPNVYATVTPIAFSFSPAKAGLRDDIKSINRIDFMLGVGYRM